MGTSNIVIKVSPQYNNMTVFKQEGPEVNLSEHCNLKNELILNSAKASLAGQFSPSITEI